jgi:hypothetical protein
MIWINPITLMIATHVVIFALYCALCPPDARATSTRHFESE